MGLGDSLCAFSLLKFLSASADILFSLSRHRKDPCNLASFISDIYCRAENGLGSHRFSKERYDFPINDFIETEAANTFTKGISGDPVSEPIEGTRNVVGMNLIVSVIGVRPILQAIHRIGELTKFRVSDCEFEFVQ
jgi:hypothetical protein